MAEVEIKYKGSNIATLDASGIKTLKTSGKYCEDDITVTYTDPEKPTQSKTVTPTASGFRVLPDDGKVLSSVVVNGDSDLIAENVKNGINIFGVTGSMQQGSLTSKTFTVVLTGTATNGQIAVASDSDVATHCTDERFVISCYKITGLDLGGGLSSVCGNVELSSTFYGVCYYNTTPIGISSNATGTSNVKIYADSDGNLRWYSSAPSTRGWYAGTYVVVVSW